ncbi:hypothetical protein ES703_110921 [subsurface metagenome]
MPFELDRYIVRGGGIVGAVGLHAELFTLHVSSGPEHDAHILLGDNIVRQISRPSVPLRVTCSLYGIYRFRSVLVGAEELPGSSFVYGIEEVYVLDLSFRIQNVKLDLSGVVFSSYPVMPGFRVEPVSDSQQWLS